MDTTNLIDKGTQAHSWKEQVEELIPKIVRHLVINLSPQKEPFSQETDKCSHEYTMTWTNILDLIINDHNASCTKQHRSVKDVNVTVTVTMPVDSGPINIPNDDRIGTGRNTEYANISFVGNGNAADDTTSDEGSDSNNQDNDQDNGDEGDGDEDDSNQGDEDYDKHKRIKINDEPFTVKHRTRSTVRSHDKPNTEGYKHACPECNRSFRLKQTLKQHMFQIHNPTFTGRKQCAVCETWFDSKEKLTSHLEAPGENHGKHPCTYCDVTCKTTYRLRRHMKSNHVIPKPVIQCEICQKIFARPKNLRGHMKIHLRPEEGDEHPCPQCDKVFKSGKALKCHVVCHKGPVRHKCDICGEGFGQAGKLRQHKGQIHGVHEQHACSVCGVIFRQKVTLDDHMLSHTGQKSLLCDLCGKSFPRLFTYQRHMTRHKQKANPTAFPCPQCHRAYPDQGRVNKHIREMHLKEKNYKCRFCPKRYFSRFNVTSHEMTHTGEYNYKCTYCDLKFIQRTQLVYHERVHTGERPHMCEICHKTFTRKDKLNEHKKKAHPPDGVSPEKSAQCKICGAVFSSRQGCLVHEKRHASVKNNICEICGAAFVNRGDLMRHIKIHTDGKPYKCKQCGLSFAKKSQLNQHVVIHVNEQVEQMSTNITSTPEKLIYLQM